MSASKIAAAVQAQRARYQEGHRVTTRPVTAVAPEPTDEQIQKWNNVMVQIATGAMEAKRELGLDVFMEYLKETFASLEKDGIPIGFDEETGEAIWPISETPAHTYTRNDAFKMLDNLPDTPNTTRLAQAAATPPRSIMAQVTSPATNPSIPIKLPNTGDKRKLDDDAQAARPSTHNKRTSTRAPPHYAFNRI